MHELAKQGGQSYLVSNTTLGESRGLDADLIDEVRSRTACRDELTRAAALCSEALSPDYGPGKPSAHQHP